MGAIDGRDLGRFGVYTFDFEGQPAGVVRESVAELDQLGWPAIWVPEVGGREAMTHAAFLLAATERITVVNGIAQIGPRTPQATAGAARLLAEAYPGRHLLGLGLGGARPGLPALTAMGDYLTELDEIAATAGPVARVLAAYGPKMVALAGDRSAGAHTYHVPVGHTAATRELLGPAPFLGVEQAVLLETDPAAARATARAALAEYVAPEATYNLAKWRRLGYTEADLEGGGSDRLVDDLVAWGDVDTVVARLHAHLDAGADHVAVQVVGTAPGTTAVPHWRTLAGALLS